MKYYVIALHFDEDRKKQCYYIAGEFPNFANARIFAEAYREHYKSDCKIIDEYILLHTNIMQITEG